MHIEPLERRQLLTVLPGDALTYHNDTSRTGQDLNETTLTPANVNPSTFGKVNSFPTDGIVYAQPLYKGAVNVPGLGSTDLLFVATQHDDVYAFNTDSGSNVPVWRDSFINPAAGITTLTTSDVGSSDIIPEIGITGTPVIDPATNTLYVVAKTKEVTGNTTQYVQRLHALDLSTGAEKFGGPVVISATVKGTGDGAVNGNVTFDALTQNQRPALLLSNGTVYVSWASHGDNPPYHGWVIGYSASDLTQPPSVLNLNPNGGDAGVWMSGDGPAVDSSGNIFLATGNGTFDASTGGNDYGDSVVKIVPGPSLAVSDYFSPYNQSTLDDNDLDFGSGGVLLLPDQPGAHPHELLVGSKSGTLYLLDRDKLGGFNPVSDAIVQELPNAVRGVYDTPAYFGGNVYIQSSGDVLKEFSLTNGLLSTTPITASTNTIAFPGSTPSISANGSSNAIVWTLNNGLQGTGPAVLYANLASDVSQQLYSSAQSGSRDTAANSVKFAVPTVANGHVYVGGVHAVTVYGLLTGPTNLTAVANPSGTVTLNWNAVSGAASYDIYRSTTPSGEGATPFVTELTGTSYTDSTALLSTSYYYTVDAVTNSGNTAQSNEVGIPRIPSTPYTGTPINLPATIQAENFDNGGEGVAYHDTDSTNQGGVYRNEGVDLEPTSDTGGGYDVGWTQTGEWMAYTFNVTSPGVYTFAPRVASAGSGGAFHLQVDSTPLGTGYTMPNTGGWQNWTTLAGVSTPLTAGTHVLRLIIDATGSGGYSGNFNYITVTGPAVNQPPTANAGNNQTITLPNKAALAGSASDDGLPNGTLTTTWSQTSGPGTATFDNASVLNTNVAFSTAGTYVLTLTASDGALSTTSNVTIVVNPVGSVTNAFSGTPPTLPATIQTEDFDNGGQGVAFNYPRTGNNGAGYRNTPITLEKTSDTGGGYDVGSVVAGEWLDYTVNVPTTGSYTFNVRVASNSGGGSIHIESDGVNVTGPMKVSNTGGWQSWQTVSSNAVSLTAGTHVLRLVVDSSPSGDLANLNWINVTGPAGAPTNQPPVVNAGSTQTITLPATASLSGTASDDGLPNNTLTTTWSQTSGPGSVTFGNANALSTTASFSTAGTYVLTLTANDSALSSTSTVTINVNAAGTSTAAYSGTPPTLPATIQAEDFDNGGQGVAFNYPRTGNNGAGYRNTPITLEKTSDTGGGYDVGSVVAGEWLDYTVNVPTTGSYTFNVRVASNSGGGSIHIESDGVNVTGPMKVSNTGGWQSWQTISSNAVTLTAGTHVLRLVVDNSPSGDLANLNWISVSGPAGAPINQPPVVNAGATQTITLPATASLSGTATDDGLPSNTLTTTWSQTSGPGTVTFGNVSAMSTTAGFSAAGTYVLTLTASDGALSSTSTVTINVNAAGTTSPAFSGTPPTLPATIQAEDFDNGGQGVAFNYPRTGNNGAGYRNTPVVLEKTGDTGGGYDVGSIVAGEWLDYTVNAPANSGYLFTLRVASNSGGGSMHVEADGTNVSGPIKITNTGGWQTWSTVSSTFALTAGVHTLRLVIDSSPSGDFANFNWFSLTPAGPNQAPVVNAGSNQTISLPAPANLSATITDDGLPTGTLTSAWSVVSGPGTVTFANATSAFTAATFSQSGTYVLKCTASDGQLTGSSTLTITVNPAVASTFAWTALAPSPIARDEGQSAVVNGKIYCFGGFDSDQYIGQTRSDVYDPSTNTWTQIADMPEAVTHAGTIVDGTTIWVIGGFIGDETAPAITHVWKYDTVSNTWSAGPSLPSGAAAGAVVLVGRNIHVISGLSQDGSGNWFNTTEHYVLSLDNPTTWTSAAAMPVPRNHLGAAVLNGKIYVVGGQNLKDENNGDSALVSVYDPTSDSWSSTASLPGGRSHEMNSVLAYQGKLLLVGGETIGGVSAADVLQYDPSTDAWYTLPGMQLSEGRKTPLVSIIGNTVYVFAGAAPAPVAGGWSGVLPSMVPAADRTLYAVNETGNVGSISVYDIDKNHKLLRTIATVPNVANVRGVAASAATGKVYVSYYNGSGTGMVYCYNINTDTVEWNKVIPPGVDRLSISPDGSTLYVPTSEDNISPSYNYINVVNASTGNVIQQVTVTTRTHDSQYPLSGPIFQEAKATDGTGRYLYEIDPTTLKVINTIGPYADYLGPYAVDSTSTYVVDNVNGVWGFQVANLKTNQIATATIPGGAPNGFAGLMHGIGWKPDQSEVWQTGGPNADVYVWNMTNPMAPVLTHTLPLITGDNYSRWLTFTINGDYAYIGPPKPAGAQTTEIFNTSTYQPVGTIPASEDMLEVDFANGAITKVGDQFGIGRK